jgi:hypothetical protein
MKSLVIAVTVTALCVTSVFAAEDKVGGGQNFETKKAEVLKRIEQRIAHNTEEKACVQAAASHDALKACREKFRAEIKNDRPGKKP